MSYKKYLIGKLKKNKLATSRSRLFFVSPKKEDIVSFTESVLILLSSYSFCIIPLCQTGQPIEQDRMLIWTCKYLLIQIKTLVREKLICHTSFLPYS